MNQVCRIDLHIQHFNVHLASGPLSDWQHAVSRARDGHVNLNLNRKSCTVTYIHYYNYIMILDVMMGM